MLVKLKEPAGKEAKGKLSRKEWLVLMPVTKWAHLMRRESPWWVWAKGRSSCIAYSRTGWYAKEVTTQRCGVPLSVKSYTLHFNKLTERHLKGDQYYFLFAVRLRTRNWDALPPTCRSYQTPRQQESCSSCVRPGFADQDMTRPKQTSISRVPRKVC